MDGKVTNDLEYSPNCCLRHIFVVFIYSIERKSFVSDTLVLKLSNPSEAVTHQCTQWRKDHRQS